MAGDEEESAIWSILKWYKIPLSLGAISILLVILSISLFIKSYQDSDPILFSSPDVTPSSVETPTVIVDIRGAIQSPGVYTLPADSRIEDALVKAGGLTGDVDTILLEKSLNRAAKVIDGAKIYVPRVGSTNDVQQQVQEAPGTSDSLVNINTASLSELEALSGVGPVTAKNILNGRPYQKIEELVERHIIGQSLFTKLKDQLSL